VVDPKIKNPGARGALGAVAVDPKIKNPGALGAVAAKN
jgi:hypothetical protein